MKPIKESGTSLASYWVVIQLHGADGVHCVTMTNINKNPVRLCAAEIRFIIDEIVREAIANDSDFREWVYGQTLPVDLTHQITWCESEARAKALMHAMTRGAEPPAPDSTLASGAN